MAIAPAYAEQRAIATNAKCKICRFMFDIRYAIFRSIKKTSRVFCEYDAHVFVGKKRKDSIKNKM
ncbi:hypothetical protein HMPREF1985_00934 [Mitsuokella sp. oral taxon 131 str. W9106]|nr:hypothetical protein HMPREF1985_00934 [Mitsuokella sp. oral taxon 131 str. W9106]